MPFLSQISGMQTQQVTKQPCLASYMWFILMQTSAKVLPMRQVARSEPPIRVKPPPKQLLDRWMAKSTQQVPPPLAQAASAAEPAVELSVGHPVVTCGTNADRKFWDEWMARQQDCRVQNNFPACSTLHRLRSGLSSLRVFSQHVMLRNCCPRHVLLLQSPRQSHPCPRNHLPQCQQAPWKATGKRLLPLRQLRRPPLRAPP